MSQTSAPLEFDVFLSHNSTDKPLVRELKQRLVERGLAVWYDEDELRPGMPWQQLLEAGIRSSRSAAVLVGDSGISPWEGDEMHAALSLAVHDKRPVIPVLLPRAKKPDVPMFLQNRTWVDLSSGFTDAGLDTLVWGITGVNPRKKGDRRPDPPMPPNAHGNSTWQSPETGSAGPAAGIADILPGGWQVQIQTPFAMGQMRIDIHPGGGFQGQLQTPMGMSAVNGQWQVNPFAGQIALRGQQTNGFQAIPYLTMIQVTQFDSQNIVGMTSAGEQVVWRRLAQ